MSSARERANGRESGSVLQSVFLAVLARSALVPELCYHAAAWHDTQMMPSYSTALSYPTKVIMNLDDAIMLHLAIVSIDGHHGLLTSLSLIQTDAN